MVHEMPRSKKGILIAIEGIDGSGKTTQSKLLFKALKERGYNVVLSHEPTEGRFGREIREKLRRNHIAPEKAYELFVMDRKEHIENKIKPALDNGAIVIIDRYFISTIAYQGAAGVSISKILEDHKQFAPIPDLVIILDIPVEEADKRLSNKSKDLFENNMNYLRKVREIYLNMKNFLNTNIIIINALRPVEEIHKEILNHVLKIIRNN